MTDKTEPCAIHHAAMEDVLPMMMGTGLLATHFADLVVTSPPYYNAREYSQYDSYREYLHQMDRCFDVIWRATAPGHFFVLISSPVIEPRPKRQAKSIRYPVPYDLHAKIMASGKSIYKTMPGVDAYDRLRDALTFSGGMPVIAHPPCRAWSVYLGHMANSGKCDTMATLNTN